MKCVTLPASTISQRHQSLFQTLVTFWLMFLMDSFRHSQHSDGMTHTHGMFVSHKGLDTTLSTKWFFCTYFDVFLATIGAEHSLKVLYTTQNMLLSCACLSVLVLILHSIQNCCQIQPSKIAVATFTENTLSCCQITERSACLKGA